MPLTYLSACLSTDDQQRHLAKETVSPCLSVAAVSATASRPGTLSITCIFAHVRHEQPLQHTYRNLPVSQLGFNPVHVEPSSRLHWPPRRCRDSSAFIHAYQRLDWAVGSESAQLDKVPAEL